MNKNINIVIPKKIKVEVASVSVANIGADITAGSFLNFAANKGITVPKILEKTITKNIAKEAAKDIIKT